MDFDDVVVGSGLSALATVLGLGLNRRVLVLAGRAGGWRYYDAHARVPCAFDGLGGLGSAWHGVIPLGWRHNFAASSDAAFSELFAHFYPHARLQGRLGTTALFVPWRAIRPQREWPRLQRERGAGLTVLEADAQSFNWPGGLRV